MGIPKSPKRYIILSSMDMHPSSVKVGSIITNLNHLEKPLSTFTPVIPPLNDHDHKKTPRPEDKATNSMIAKGTSNELVADTHLTVTPGGPKTGTINRSGAWGIGVFATFLQQLIRMAQLSVGGSSANRLVWQVEETTTSRLVPSERYRRAALADEEVAYLDRNRHSTRVYLIVAVMVAKGLTVVRANSEKGAVEGLLGADLATAGVDGTVGLKGHSKEVFGFYHREEYPGPVVFAFEVEQIWLSPKGKVKRVDSDRIKGTMLGSALGEGEEETEIMAENEVDEDMLERFGLESVAGVDEGGETCEVFVATED